MQFEVVDGSDVSLNEWTQRNARQADGESKECMRGDSVCCYYDRCLYSRLERLYQGIPWLYNAHNRESNKIENSIVQFDFFKSELKCTVELLSHPDLLNESIVVVIEVPTRLRLLTSFCFSSLLMVSSFFFTVLQS
jgi:hypothetical protein